VYLSSALLIELSDQMVACKDSVKLKQLDTRLSSFSGFFNLAFTVGYAFLDSSNSDLYAAIMKLTTITTLSCNDIGLNFGKVIANMLEAKSPSEVFYNAVNQNISK
jgi:hypothetical protein